VLLVDNFANTADICRFKHRHSRLGSCVAFNLPRNPHNVFTNLEETLPRDRLLPPVPAEVNKEETLTQTYKNLDAVVSLVEILQSSLSQFAVRGHSMERGGSRRPKACRAVRFRTQTERGSSLSRCYHHSTEFGVGPGDSPINVSTANPS
jgi:hypothetical protein